MVKGTPSFGKRHKTSVIKCRRCGRRAYHIRHKRCAACGFGESKRFRSYAWQTRSVERQRRLL